MCGVSRATCGVCSASRRRKTESHSTIMPRTWLQRQTPGRQSVHAHDGSSGPGTACAPRRVKHACAWHTGPKRFTVSNLRLPSPIRCCRHACMFVQWRSSRVAQMVRNALETSIWHSPWSAPPTSTTLLQHHVVRGASRRSRSRGVHCLWVRGAAVRRRPGAPMRHPAACCTSRHNQCWPSLSVRIGSAAGRGTCRLLCCLARALLPPRGRYGSVTGRHAWGAL